MGVGGAALSAIVILVVGTLLGKLLHACFRSRKQKPLLESAKVTLSRVEVANICSFCGKSINADERMSVKMHRHIKSEICFGGNRFIYENISVYVPCCDACKVSNQDQARRADRKSLCCALVLSALTAVGVLFAKAFTHEISRSFLASIFAAVGIGFCSYSLIRKIVAPRFESELLKTNVVESLLREGWKIGESDGQPVD